MSKLISELIKEWKEYSEEVKAESKKTLDAIFEQHKEMSKLWREEIDRINNEPPPKCLFSGRELFKMKQYPPMPPLHIPKLEGPTMEGFMDYLTDKQSNLENN